ncbi:hypothetical protein HGRIS_011267 [Hohenbuehelia grisea]|uniref:HNH nuclease domain-containing protein n=1 Tax=Hohenbuehelia grisea TaxID=104357 RepID=A0ABR3JUK8_9AGAR
MAVPLPVPTDVEHKFAHLPANFRSAYRVCRDFEAFSLTSKNSQSIISARVLGYLLLHAPSDQALAEVVATIHSCNADHDSLHSLGDAFVNWFIRAFRQYKGGTPATSERSSRSSFDRDHSLLNVSVEEAPKDHIAAQGQALKRDGYRCQVSGRYDALANTVLKLPLEILLEYGSAVNTECAHIVPASTYFDVNTGESTHDTSKRDYAASVLAVLKCSGYDIEKLKGANVHSLFNVMTLEYDVHYRFDKLQLWLEATNTPNQYRIRVADPCYATPRRELVTFSTSDPVHLPLPSAELLALHATCAKVAHLSGAAEYLDNMERRLKVSQVLASDGSSAAVLHYAIAGLAGDGIHVGA